MQASHPPDKPGMGRLLWGSSMQILQDVAQWSKLHGNMNEKFPLKMCAKIFP